MRNLIKAIVTISILGLSFQSHAGLFSSKKPKAYKCKLTIADNGKTGSVIFETEIAPKGADSPTSVVRLGYPGKSLGLPAGHEYVTVQFVNLKATHSLFGIKYSPSVDVQSGAFKKNGKDLANGNGQVMWHWLKPNVRMHLKTDKMLDSYKGFRVNQSNGEMVTKKSDSLKKYDLVCKRK